jgi:hypothetical protein
MRKNCSGGMPDLPLVVCPTRSIHPCRGLERPRRRPYIAIELDHKAAVVAEVVLRTEPYYLSHSGRGQIQSLLETYERTGVMDPVPFLFGRRRYEPRTFRPDGGVHEWGCWIHGVRITAIPGVVLDLQNIVRTELQQEEPEERPSTAAQLQRWVASAS